jgi:hypothetical protein
MVEATDEIVDPELAQDILRRLQAQEAGRKINGATRRSASVQRDAGLAVGEQQPQRHVLTS